jgi:hypothetical protein
MKLFRSEEHVCNWSSFKADSEEGINQLSDVVALSDLFFCDGYKFLYRRKGQTKGG